MEQIVPKIFETLGGATAIAKGINSPVQTVHAWLGTKDAAKPEIPPWRRADVLSFAREQGKLTELTADCLAYLQSQERTVGKRVAA